MDPREKREQQERFLIGEFGIRAENSKGRAQTEEPCRIRTCFQRDVDRIIHSKSFRRLKHKTQVFLQPEGDHYRTRLTHTLEVSRIARTIARSLALNEDLAEAISLGHDLGHTPFGHAGERALNDIVSDEGGFRHYEQSLRVVDILEKDGKGLNLTWEVRNGIVRHTTDPLAATLEGQAVRLADRIAYVNHDVDDAVRAGIISEEEIPEKVTSVLGERHSVRIDTITRDLIEQSVGKQVLCMSPSVADAVEVFHDFLYANVYRNPKAKGEESKVRGILEVIFSYYMKHMEKLPPEILKIAEQEGARRAVCDYVSGMTDTYAIYEFSQIYVPNAWQVR